MDAYDYEKIDKAMSKRVDAIYGDPSRHKFYSFFDFHTDNLSVGPRGGKVIGRKRICAHCGNIKEGHAETTEQI